MQKLLKILGWYFLELKSVLNENQCQLRIFFYFLKSKVNKFNSYQEGWGPQWVGVNREQRILEDPGHVNKFIVLREIYFLISLFFKVFLVCLVMSFSLYWRPSVLKPWGRKISFIPQKYMVLCFSLVSSELGPKLVGSETCNTDENGQYSPWLAKIMSDKTVGWYFSKCWSLTTGSSVGVSIL